MKTLFIITSLLISTLAIADDQKPPQPPKHKIEKRERQGKHSQKKCNCEKKKGPRHDHGPKKH